MYTRTGRAFFAGDGFEARVLDRVRAAFDRIDLWDELDTDWAILDCELLPWSAKAEELLRRQYASVGAAATRTLDAEAAVYAEVAARLDGTEPLATRAAARARDAERFVDAYRRYCWTVDGVDDLALAPFQVLATEGRLRALEPHPWHLAVISSSRRRRSRAAPRDGRARGRPRRPSG